MTKYKAIIELKADRDTCINCPLCDADDVCQLQELGQTETWQEQLITCPLVEVESE